MLRGCQKRIIYLKNTDSDVFDEAYFVVSDKNSPKTKECDMVEEARRILDECASTKEGKGKRTEIKRIFKEKIPPFLIGIAVGIITVLLIK